MIPQHEKKTGSEANSSLHTSRRLFVAKREGPVSSSDADESSKEGARSCSRIRSACSATRIPTHDDTVLKPSLLLRIELRAPVVEFQKAESADHS